MATCKFLAETNKRVSATLRCKCIRNRQVDGIRCLQCNLGDICDIIAAYFLQFSPKLDHYKYNCHRSNRPKLRFWYENIGYCEKNLVTSVSIERMQKHVSVNVGIIVKFKDKTCKNHPNKD